MRELHTEVTIEAAPETVFRILLDVARYQEWNPLIVSAKGEVVTGGKLDIRIRPPGKRDQAYVVQVVRVVPDREFVWVGHMKARGILDGMHFFELFPLGEAGVRVVHREEFRGLLVPLVWRAFLDTRMRSGFEALNRSLKECAERFGQSTI